MIWLVNNCKKSSIFNWLLFSANSLEESDGAFPTKDEFVRASIMSLLLDRISSICLYELKNETEQRCL